MATFSPLDAARYLSLEGVLIATSHFAGIRHLKKAKKNLKPPAALRGLASGGPTGKTGGARARNLAAPPRMSHLKQETALPSTEHMFLVGCS